MSASLVGSEMCIRDSRRPVLLAVLDLIEARVPDAACHGADAAPRRAEEAVSYTHLTLPTICSV
eukprot:6473004-Alexandrium_andersonii.AAC.1